MNETPVEHRLQCIVCPEGCQLVVREANGELLFTEKACRRGQEYARQEIVDPHRVVTTTVRITHGAIRMLPVKTAAPVPKEKIMTVMGSVASIEVEAPVAVGQVVCPDVAHTGIALVACRTVPRG